MAVEVDSARHTPEAVLRSFIHRLEPSEQKLVHSVRAALRKRLPTANELVYDDVSHSILSCSPTERGIHTAASIVARANGVQLSWKPLPDPKRLLMGSRSQARYIWIEAAKQWSHPDVKALIAAAIDQESVPLPSTGKGTLVVRPTAAGRPLALRAKK